MRKNKCRMRLTCVDVVEVLVHHDGPGGAVGIRLDDKKGGVLVLAISESLAL